MGGHGHPPSEHGGHGDREHGAGNQPSRQMGHEKHEAADGADRKRLKELEGLGAGGEGVRQPLGDLDHGALWQIGQARTNALKQSLQCNLVIMSRWYPIPLIVRRMGSIDEGSIASPSPLRPSCTRRGTSCAPCHAVPWCQLPWSIRSIRGCGPWRAWPSSPWRRAQRSTGRKREWRKAAATRRERRPGGKKLS